MKIGMYLNSESLDAIKYIAAKRNRVKETSIQDIFKEIIECGLKEKLYVYHCKDGNERYPVEVERELYFKLTAYAEKQGISISYTMREFIEIFLQEEAMKESKEVNNDKY